MAEVSPATQELVDREVRRIVEAAHEEVTALLTEHRDKLDALAQALLRAETLDEDEAYEAAGIERRPPSEEPSPTPLVGVYERRDTSSESGQP